MRGMSEHDVDDTVDNHRPEVSHGSPILELCL